MGAAVVGLWGFDGGCVWFWVCSRWRERERERERDKNERKERDYYCKYIYFIVWIYYFNVLNRNIKVGMLDVL